MDVSDEQFYLELKKMFFYGTVKDEKRQTQLFAPLGINNDTYRCLDYLRSHPQGVEPGRLSDELMILRQTMTYIIDRLEKRGLVERIPHPSDRRRILIRLKPEGEKLADRAIEMSKDYLMQVSHYFSGEELDEYIRLRNRLSEVKDEVLNRIVRERERG